MSEDWDLYAVVRGCSATTPTNDQNNVNEEFLTDFDSLSFDQNDESLIYDYSFDDQGSSLKFEGLEEIYRSFDSQQQPDQVLVENVMEQTSPIFDQYSLPLRSSSRRRRNQLSKLVREMTHEELMADSWAWRKYGQKPIKGSPYPRNYYRCSTSKGCPARKQMEKSPADPNLHIVTYSGNHTHPRPTHRNSLAGSTRNKSTSRANPGPTQYSSSSQVTTLDFSPTRENESVSSYGTHRDNVVEMEDEDDMLVTNVDISDEKLKGFEELEEDVSEKWEFMDRYYTP